jgi:phosphate transport system permease protein
MLLESRSGLQSSRVVSRAAAPRGRRSGLADLFFANLTRALAFLTLLTLLGIVLSLGTAAWPSIEKFGASFLWTSQWNPPAEQFGALVPIYGTLVTSAIALLIAVPVSFGIALFLTELSPVWLRRPLGIAIELLAAIPSTVYGMWGLLVFAPVFAHYVQPVLGATLGNLPLIGALFQGPPLGIGLLAAGIILAIMIIPFIASVMRDVFSVTPAMLKESAYALGATTWEVVAKVVLPYTRLGVVGGIMLGLGRALGETMAVTFVIGNTNLLSNVSLFSPGNSITSALANEFQEADPGLHSAALIELGLILLMITLLVLTVSKLLLMRLSANEGAKT